MARIKQLFGRSLPIATLFERPTIRTLAAALRDGVTGTAGVGPDGRAVPDAADRDHRRALVPIRPDGDRPPLLFVHPVSGDVLCYAELAALAGERQPFFGLQVPDTTEPLVSVGDLARHYAGTVLEAFPTGSFRLGGWSMGGVVALEVARQLRATGREVDLVVMVDVSEPPGAGAGRQVSDATLLSWFAGDLAGLSGRTWHLPAEELDRAGPVGALPLLRDRARSLGLLPDDVDLPTVAAVVSRFCVNFRALLGHQPAGYDGRVRVVRATAGATAATARAWLTLLPGDAGVVEIPGNHYSVVRAPHVHELARVLRHALDEAEGPARDDGRNAE